MKILDRFNQLFGFTKTESQVVLFLIGAFIVGFGIRMVHPPASAGSGVDYSAADSEFAARSAAAGAADTTVDPRQSDPATPAARHRGGEQRVKGGPPDRPININTAPEGELVRLPGIGPAIAARIVAYRNDHGPFPSVRSLRNVKGIGEKKFEQIASYCTTGE